MIPILGTHTEEYPHRRPVRVATSLRKGLECLFFLADSILPPKFWSGGAVVMPSSYATFCKAVQWSLDEVEVSFTTHDVWFF